MTKKARILVVEDESIIAKDIQYTLQDMGYLVPEIVFSGEDAIASAKENRPDMVLMDITLNGEMGGIEAARQIYSDMHIPVVFLTGYTDDQTIGKAKHARPFGFLIKPFDDLQLKTTVELALKRAEAEGYGPEALHKHNGKKTRP
jgi:CheY-like chemotaxis protein